MPLIGYRHTDEARAKMSAAHRGKKLSPEHRAKLRGDRNPAKRPEVRVKIAAALRGRPKSEEHRAKMVAAHRGVPLSDEHRTKLSAALRGAKSVHWKGDDVCYAAMHYRARDAHAGEPCVQADETCKGQLECAFDHEAPEEHVRYENGRPWSVDVRDCVRLCASHHQRYDAAQRAVV